MNLEKFIYFCFAFFLMVYSDFILHYSLTQNWFGYSFFVYSGLILGLIYNSKSKGEGE